MLNPSRKTKETLKLTLLTLTWLSWLNFMAHAFNNDQFLEGVIGGVLWPVGVTLGALKFFF